MAGFLDVCFLLLTTAFFLGAILGTAFFTQKCRALIDATKASWEERGWVVAQGDSNGGGGGGNKATLVVKTNRWTDQERYLDATQRGVMKVVQASTFGDRPAPQAPEALSATSSGKGDSGPDKADESSHRDTVRRLKDQLLSKVYAADLASAVPGGDSGSDRADESSSRQKVKNLRDQLLSKLYYG